MQTIIFNKIVATYQNSIEGSWYHLNMVNNVVVQTLTDNSPFDIGHMEQVH